MNVLCFRRSMILGIAALAVTASTARADVALWYNGDYDNRDSLTNQSQVPINTGTGFVLQTSLVYDNFVVPAGQVWTLTSVFSNNQMAYAANATTATWQIRSGVVAGNGGTLVASGDTAATQVALPPVNGNTYFDPEYRVTASVPSLKLAAGTYWLAVSPDSTGFFGDQSYIETTSGKNAIGTPKGSDGNSYITTNFPTSGPFAYNFTPSTTALAGDGDGPNIDFSMGVIGTSAAAAVPEPSSLMLAVVAAGLLWIVPCRSSTQDQEERRRLTHASHGGSIVRPGSDGLAGSLLHSLPLRKFRSSRGSTHGLDSEAATRSFPAFPDIAAIYSERDGDVATPEGTLHLRCPRINRTKSAMRRRSSLSVEGLENRELLTVAPVLHNLIAPIHASAVHTAKGGIHATSLAISKAETHLLAIHEAKLEARAEARVVRQERIRASHLIPLDDPYVPTLPLSGGAQNTSPITGTLIPTQIETAYGVNLLGVANQGQGVTIGIVDNCFDDPQHHLRRERLLRSVWVAAIRRYRQRSHDEGRRGQLDRHGHLSGGHRRRR